MVESYMTMVYILFTVLQGYDDIFKHHSNTSLHIKVKDHLYVRLTVCREREILWTDQWVLKSGCAYRIVFVCSNDIDKTLCLLMEHLIFSKSTVYQNGRLLTCSHCTS